MTSKNKDSTSTFHRINSSWVKRLFAPEEVFVKVVLAKLKEQGIDGSLYIEKFKEAYIDANKNGGRDGLVKVVTGDARIDNFNISLDISDPTVDEVIKSIQREVTTGTTAALESFHREELSRILRKPERRLLDMECERDAFERRLALTWKAPLQLSEIQLALSLELGEIWSKQLRGRKSKKGAVIEVITRLHARSIQIAHEIQALLRGGFADGALARWRTLHELAVVSFFITQNGEATARMYLDHLSIETYKAALGYQTAAPLLGYERLPEKDVDQLVEARNRLHAKYGPQFTKDYGWAAAALNGKPTNFASLEEAVELDKYRPYFKMASNNVHAGPHGLFLRLGVIRGDLLLAGASNAGLEEAMRLSALSVAQVSICLLLLRETLDSQFWAKILLELSAKIETEAVRTKKRIDREELRLAREFGETR